MAGRADDADRIAELVGRDVLRITDVGSGWPALGELTVESRAVPVAVWAAPVGLSHRNRDEIERRFQNPGGDRPIIDLPGRVPLLLGLWERDQQETVTRPLLVSADPVRRMARTTRFSVFASMATLKLALKRGWAEGFNAVGENIRCFVPPLLPLSFDADRGGVALDEFAVQAAIAGSGLLDAPESDVPAASARARAAGSRLIRDARFSSSVLDAYGRSCAMCGLGAGLVQGAHIYPVAAPGSNDEPWNGLCLCANHHLAFDRHVVGVMPMSMEIVTHNSILEQASTSRAVAALVDVTFDRLASPRRRTAQPRAEMFQKRYEFFADQYRWIVS